VTAASCASSSSPVRNGASATSIAAGRVERLPLPPVHAVRREDLLEGQLEQPVHLFDPPPDRLVVT
jgi:hypothetical protein